MKLEWELRKLKGQYWRLRRGLEQRLIRWVVRQVEIPFYYEDRIKGTPVQAFCLCVEDSFTMSGEDADVHLTFCDDGLHLTVMEKEGK